MTRTVILINGKARSGKDTLANLILRGLRLHTKDYDTISVMHNASSVKHIARTFFTWDNEKDDKGRQLLIDITNSAYKYDKYFWEKKTHHFIKNYNSRITIIPDWRYMSTYDFFKEEGYNVITIHLERKHLDNGLSDSLKNDKSELGFGKFNYDYTVRNETDNLDNVRQMVEQLFVPQLIKRLEL